MVILTIKFPEPAAKCSHRGIKVGVCRIIIRKNPIERSDYMNIPYPDPREKQEFSEDDMMNTSSDRDCTGLIPAQPSELESENYSELYDFLPKAVSDGKNDGC